MALQPINYGALGGNALGSFVNTRNQIQNLKSGEQQLKLGEQNIGLGEQRLALGDMKLKEGQQREQQAINQQQLQQQAADVFQSGNPDDIASFMIANPSMQDAMIGADKFASERSKQSKIEAARNIVLGSNSSDELMKSAKVIAEEGGNPADTLSFISQPDEVKKKASESIWASLDPQGYKAYKELGKSQEVKPMTEYQSIQTELRKAEAEERKLDRQIKRETNEIKRDELKSQISQAKTKTEQLKKTDSTRIDNAVVEAKGKKATINELLANQDYIDSLTGYTGRLPVNLTDAGVEAEGILDNIKNSMTIENLSVMSGPLTDKDIQVIASASSRLKTGMSESALRKELDRINGAYDRVIKNYGKEANRKGYKKQNEEAVKNKNEKEVKNKNEFTTKNGITFTVEGG